MSEWVVLTWAEFDAAAYVGFRRVMHAAYAGLRDKARGYSPDHLYGAVAERVVAKALGLYWLGNVGGNGGSDRVAGDLTAADGTVLEVRFSWHGELKVRGYDADEHWGVLVRGTYPRFEIVGALRLGDGKQQCWWRDVARPYYCVPDDELHPWAEVSTAWANQPNGHWARAV